MSNGVKIHQTRNEFHGGDFAGPQLRRLTDADSMQFLQKLLQTAAAPQHAILFFDAMAALVSLTKVCFSKKISDCGYASALRSYKRACSALPVKKCLLRCISSLHILITPSKRLGEDLVLIQNRHSKRRIMISIWFGSAMK